MITIMMMKKINETVTQQIHMWVFVYYYVISNYRLIQPTTIKNIRKKLNITNKSKFTLFSHLFIIVSSIILTVRLYWFTVFSVDKLTFHWNAARVEYLKTPSLNKRCDVGEEKMSDKAVFSSSGAPIHYVTSSNLVIAR